MKVRPYLEGEEMFLANYTDGLTDLPLDIMIEEFNKVDRTATFLAYQPTQSFHVVSMGNNGDVEGISPIGSSGLWINAGYFIFRKNIFDYMQQGEELVIEPFQRLIKARQLHAYKYEGFWISLDTFKDKQQIDEMYARGQTPWKVWTDEHALE